MGGPRGGRAPLVERGVRGAAAPPGYPVVVLYLSRTGSRSDNDQFMGGWGRGMGAGVGGRGGGVSRVQPFPSFCVSRPADNIRHSNHQRLKLVV